MEFLTHASKARSILHFVLLAIFLFVVVSFVLKKANDAVAEMDGLNSAPIYLGVKKK